MKEHALFIVNDAYDSKKYLVKYVFVIKKNGVLR
jgi:hypothetical protein